MFVNWLKHVLCTVRLLMGELQWSQLAGLSGTGDRSRDIVKILCCCGWHSFGVLWCVVQSYEGLD